MTQYPDSRGNDKAACGKNQGSGTPSLTAIFVELRFWRRILSERRGPGVAIPDGVMASLWSPGIDGLVLVTVEEDISGDFPSDIPEDERSPIYLVGDAAREGAVLVPLETPNDAQLRLLRTAVDTGWAVEPRVAGLDWREVEN